MRAHLAFIGAVVAAAGCSDHGGDGDTDGGTDIDPHCHPITAAGVCNVIEQCGCEAGLTCAMVFDDLTCTYFEDCTAQPPGSTGAEGQCYDGWPTRGECRPGMACLWKEEMYSYRCHEWCLTDEDCSVEGRTCTVPQSYWDMDCTGPVDAPVMTCSMSF
jgi:hypothetical protein